MPDLSAPVGLPPLLPRAWYSASIAEFSSAKSDTIIGQLATNGSFELRPTQRDAWLEQIDILRSSVESLTGSLYLEFTIPRMGKRIDAVLLVGPAVFAIEFKVGESRFDRAAIDQAWDYALDLKNFHEASHQLPIIPILVATHAPGSAALQLAAHADNVYRPLLVNAEGLPQAVNLALDSISGASIDENRWINAPYRPTPTIIEAARALYAQHSVEAIARHDAGAQNLACTSARIEELVDEARVTGRKIICFVTGVPGAGKTLVGLNISTRRRDEDDPAHAVFLSGNGPLVAVLREALTRDEVQRQRELGNRVRKGKVGESVKAFIQNVHHFRDDALVDPRPPVEHVTIFDEAQRAWNLAKTADFMKRKKKRAGFNQSESEFLISTLDRHEDWAAIVCLVGGGQEINTGEAGISAWLKAINDHFPHWYMYISSQLIDSEYAAGRAIEVAGQHPNAVFDDSLHLAVSMRSFRAENVSAFVKAVLDIDRQSAVSSFAKLMERYPVAVTRDLTAAKHWVRARARGSERYGLVASSSAQRLKPHAIDIRVDVNPVHWFLNGREDTRSSYYLEDAATEFQVQGLEVDWACVTWDADLRITNSGWSYHEFQGSRWRNVKDLERRRYLLNAYRVLLTRARQGMVIFVPPGDDFDLTRSPQFYDATYQYLKDLGIPEIHQ